MINYLPCIVAPFDIARLKWNGGYIPREVWEEESTTPTCDTQLSSLYTQQRALDCNFSKGICRGIP